MTHKERVYAALNHEQPDQTPYCIGFTQKAHASMTEAYPDTDFIGMIDNSVHGVAANPGPLAMAVDDLTSQDEFGVRWDKSIDRDIGNVCNRTLPERNLDSLEMPDPHAPDKFTGFDAQIAAGEGKFVQYGIGFSLYERAWTMRGMAELMMDMVEDPDFVHALLDAICDYNVALVEQAVTYDIDAVHFGDDWGSQRGLQMGPERWEEFIMPRLARQYGAAKDAGKFVTIHSCGMVQEVFPQLIECGLDCFNPFQPEVMDPYEMKAQFGDRLSFWGGVSTQKLLPYGSPDEVRAECRKLMAEVGKDGGYILAPAHAIPGDAKPENLMAMIETVNDQ
ncbi:MAG TPA: uroporphyrinogen decarboxylase family protein [Armatimonadota bacterium]|nr:uroporphyrinogen decarboxylase family protein [Armatimonadota bacterium]